MAFLIRTYLEETQEYGLAFIFIIHANTYQSLQVLNLHLDLSVNFAALNLCEKSSKQECVEFDIPTCGGLSCYGSKLTLSSVEIETANNSTLVSYTATEMAVMYLNVI